MTHARLSEEPVRQYIHVELEPNKTGVFEKMRFQGPKADLLNMKLFFHGAVYPGMVPAGGAFGISLDHFGSSEDFDEFFKSKAATEFPYFAADQYLTKPDDGNLSLAWAVPSCKSDTEAPALAMGNDDVGVIQVNTSTGIIPFRFKCHYLKVSESLKKQLESMSETVDVELTRGFACGTKSNQTSLSVRTCVCLDTQSTCDPVVCGVHILVPHVVIGCLSVALTPVELGMAQTLTG
jgi:hypothetical protein